jgi:CheY-like chemotaxis protein
LSLRRLGARTCSAPPESRLATPPRRSHDDASVRALSAGAGPAVVPRRPRLWLVEDSPTQNAIKFTPERGLLRVIARRKGTHAVLRVEDTGAGIMRDFLPYVFERFRQAEGAPSRRRSRLGLAIVKHLVEMHGGSVGAESEGEGKGAAFTVRVPLASSRLERPAPPPLAETTLAMQVPPELEGLRVLVVVDEPDARDLVRSILEHCKMRVETAADADEAFRLLCSSKPDVLISDVAMPGGDGYSLVRRMRELPPEQGGRAPAVTAYARSEDRTRALLAGYNHHLPKPIDPSELVVVSIAGSLGPRGEGPRSPD